MILVTGATGNVGREIVKLLADASHSVRATVSSEEIAKKLPRAGVEHIVFNFDDSRTFDRAFAGVDRLFLMRPPAISDIKHTIKPVIDYAGEVGVKQIVFLSLVGAEKNRVVPHAKVETFLRASGVPYTFLRCGFFMQNLSTTHRQDICDNNDIFIPAGHGKTAFVDVRDIAEVAVKTLTESGHENKAYPLTGSEALSYFEVADLFSQVLGRTITYSDPSPLRFAWRIRQHGHPWGYVSVMTAIYLTTRFGMAQAIAPEMAQLLGCPPIRMQQFIADFAELWRPSA